MNPNESTSVQKSIRFPSDLFATLERMAESRGMSSAALVKEAARRYVEVDRQQEALQSLEERVAASIGRLTREQRNMRNDVHVAMAMVDTLAKAFFLHTPRIPREAVDGAAAEAHERHEKFTRQVVAALQGGEGLWADLDAAADASGETNAVT